MSVLLFYVYIDDLKYLLRRVIEGVVLPIDLLIISYADNMALVAPTHSPMKKFLDIFNNLALPHDCVYSPSITEIVISYVSK